jgi:hypothetical protein
VTYGAVTYPLGDERKLYWIDGFLPPEQCASILNELDFAFWAPSTVTDYKLYREREHHRELVHAAPPAHDAFDRSPSGIASPGL